MHQESSFAISIFTQNFMRLKLKINYAFFHYDIPQPGFPCVLLFLLYVYNVDPTTLIRLVAIAMFSVRWQKLNPSVVCNCGRLISFPFYKIANLLQTSDRTIWD